MTTHELDWDHVYLLYYVGRDGTPYLTTWGGEGESVEIVVTGVGSVPLWDAPVPPEAELHWIPEGRDGEEYAAEINGLYAVGWYIPKGDVLRDEYNPLHDPQGWDAWNIPPYKEIKAEWGRPGIFTKEIS